MSTVATTLARSTGTRANPSGSPVRGRVLLALLAVYAIWSSTFFALRFMVADLPPLSGSGVRFTLAGALLYAVLRARGEAGLQLRQWLLCGAIGTLMFFVGNGLIAIAAQQVPSGMTAMSIGTVPLFLAVMEAALGQRTEPRKWLGMALGFAGVATIGVADAAAPRGALLLLLVAPIGWAAASLIVRRHSGEGVPSRNRLPSGPIAGAAQLMGGGVALCVGGAVRGEQFSATPGPAALIAFAYLVVFGSIVAFSCALYLLRNAPASVATSYAYVNPVLAVALGAWLGGERVSPSVMGAGALVVVGVVLLVTPPRTAQVSTATVRVR